MRVRPIALLAALLAAASCGTEPGQRFFAQLTGINVVPPNTVTGASARADFTARAGGVEFALSVQNIVGVTQAHVHAGAAGAAGAVVATLYTSASPTGPITSATLATGTLRAADLGGMSLDSLLALLRTRRAYADVHTSGNPGGEIRGQIGPN